MVVDDETRADDAYHLACEGTALLWRGDFQNARQLLTALARRIDRPPRRRKRKAEPSQVQAFHLYRQARAQRARTLAMLLIPFEPGHVVALKRAPDVVQACTEAYGSDDEPYVTSLRELLGLIGAHEWRQKGVPIPALGGDRIHPHYGVFSPVRGEYVDLVAEAPLPPATDAFDIGTGTGVLAAVLARRGIRRVIATDQDPRALACAHENIRRLDVADRVEVVQADLYPEGRAGLVVCNPPWVPAKPSSPLEHAVYDPDGRMLRGFLDGLAEHLDTDGEGWLILSDLAEHLGLRTRDDLLRAFGTSGLEVAGRLDTTPTHPRAADPGDPLHAARSAEVTSLWRLRRGSGGRSPGR
ncbi:class I SAM-dependent methyltransferase [Actinomadura graeca]|uniref:Class I SAM-dependent methyltransferase n=1 Tax=Actinomadura graeca TaxID=2750812 RepID=A0ABX8QWR7_9ACTN|nr:class I SAM-dependent methyltransferase [Actinomadura graeca]QXJ23058.1 class I SAM-dependent methyltransferase [Actinomadura graeca]